MAQGRLLRPGQVRFVFAVQASNAAMHLEDLAGMLHTEPAVIAASLRMPLDELALRCRERAEQPASRFGAGRW